MLKFKSKSKMRFLMISFSFTILMGAVFLTSSAAQALTISCVDVGCIGGSYTLDIVSTGRNSYEATYTIDTSGVFSVSATALSEIEFKVANDYSAVRVVSGPTGTLMNGPLNGRGCGGGNNATFICLDLDRDLQVGGSYTWTLTFESSGLIAEDEWHVGARYTSPRHRNGWVISEVAGASPVPEPGAAMLFGAGLFVAGRATRKRI